MKEVKEAFERPETNLSMVQGLQCFPWPRRQSSPSLQEENMKEIVLRRSASERKLAKEKKKERKEKALSVHFGEKTPPGNNFQEHHICFVSSVLSLKTSQRPRTS